MLVGAIPQFVAGKMNATATFLQKNLSTAAGATHTHSAQNLGAEEGTRRIIAAVTGYSNGPSANSISSVTIGGVSATLAKSQAAGNSVVAGIYIADVPTGTTGDVVVTFGKSNDACTVSLYRVLNLNSAAATHTNSTTASSSTTISTTSDINADGFGVAVAASDPTLGSTATWSGLTEDAETSSTSNSVHTSASATFAQAQSGLSVGVTYTQTQTDAAIAVASWAN